MNDGAQCGIHGYLKKYQINSYTLFRKIMEVSKNAYFWLLDLKYKSGAQRRILIYIFFNMK